MSSEYPFDSRYVKDHETKYGSVKAAENASHYGDVRGDYTSSRNPLDKLHLRKGQARLVGKQRSSIKGAVSGGKTFGTLAFIKKSAFGVDH